MATRSVETSAGIENVFKKVRRQIEVAFDSLLEKAIERKEVLLRQLDKWEEEFNRTRASCIQSLEEIKRERDEMEELLSNLKRNTARISMEKGIADLNNEINEEENKVKNYQFQFVCDINELNFSISQFGSLTRDTNAVVRDYTQVSKPLMAFSTFGKGKGEFTDPRGVVVDNDNQRLFIVDWRNHRIQVWSIGGDYLFEFGEGILQSPRDIALCDNFIYISDNSGHFLSKWCLNAHTLVKKSGNSQGPKPGQLDWPSVLDIDEQEVFVMELHNKRISVFDLDLNFKRIMANNQIVSSYCLRVRNNKIYIVEDNGIIKLFSKTDQLLKTIPNLPSFSVIIYHFYLDSQLNILIPGSGTSLFILSPEGDLIHSINYTKFGLKEAKGIDVSKDGRIVISFEKGTNAIAIF